MVHYRASPSPPRAESVSKETLFICPRHTNWYLKAITLCQACSITLYVLTHFHPQMNPGGLHYHCAHFINKEN